jgi:O-antigen/teichoic acid export membrane protein
MSAHRRNRRIAASAAFGILQRVVQAFCTFLLIPRLLGTLGAASFGVWGAATSLVWLTGLADMGTGSALVTMVAQSVAVEDFHQARTRITSALTIGSSLAAFIFLLTFLAWAFGAMPDGSAPYLIALIALTLHIPLNSANNVWMALQKGYVSGFWELMQTVLTTVAVFVAFGSTKNVLVYVTLVYGGLLVANFGSLIHLFLRHPELRPRELPESLASLKEMGESGIMFFILGIAGSLSFMLDNVLALQWLGPEASARMTIAMRICMTAVSLMVVLSQPLWPAFAEAAHTADRRWIRRSLLRGTALMVGATAAGSVILLLWGERLLRLWLHADLGIGTALLWAISAWVVTQALLRVPGLLLNGLLLIRFQIGVFSVATLVSFALKFLLVRWLGTAGILWGTSIAGLLITFPASMWRIYRWARQSSAQQGFPAAPQFGASGSN